MSSDNATAILSIKGTSAGLLGGGGPTVRKDKLNDNLMFSCCCAHVDWTWSTVCGCFGGGNKCDEDCVEDALTDESLFYPVGIVSIIYYLIFFSPS
jgi:lipase ATG15